MAFAPQFEAADSYRSPEASAADFREKLIEVVPHLRAFARMLTRHRERADELCLDVLAKAWRRRSRFLHDGELKPWLFRILRNQFYSEARCARRIRPLEAVWPTQTQLAPEMKEAVIPLLGVVHAMELLPDAQREALILVSAGDFSYQEGAEICGCAVGTIKSRVGRARLAVLAALPA
jgi:RNA polymerase sigma-70 factor, ECF subfamily